MRFTVITPTIGRSTLQRCCESLDRQRFKDWQHIVMIDGPMHHDLGHFGSPEHPNRIVLECEVNHNDGGSTCRHDAWGHITGDYVLYLDDDDFYINETFEVLSQNISGENFGMFPSLFRGKVFFNPPPKPDGINICQYYHKPTIDGQPIKYPAVKDYGIDGKFAQELSQKYGYKAIESLPLVQADALNMSKFF